MDVHHQPRCMLVLISSLLYVEATNSMSEKSTGSPLFRHTLFLYEGSISSLLDPEQNDRIYHIGPRMHLEQHLQTNSFHLLAKLQDLLDVSIAHEQNDMSTYRIQDAPQSVRAPCHHQSTRFELPH